MTALFLKLLNMSITASYLILAVIVLRLVFKRAPKWIHCLLWALVAVRLLCPISMESALSLIPSSEPLPTEVVQYAPRPTIHSGVTVIDNAVNPVMGEIFAASPETSVNPLYVWTSAASVVWAVGVAVLLLYAAVSYLRLHRVVRESTPLWDDLYLCDHIETPFILGVFRPRVYLPSDLSDAQMQSVVAHERAHLARRDHWWKPLGWMLLTVYWFDPLCWVAYILLCRDIELACDEKVIRSMDAEGKKAYSMALLSCSVPRRLISACPLAFGEVGVKERIKGVLNYKKPTFWVIALAVVACIAAAVCFLTNPKEDSDTPSPFADPVLYETAFPLTDGKVGTIYLHGKETSEYHYGISEVELEWDDGTVTAFSVEDAMRAYWADIPDHPTEYTEAPLTDGAQDGGLRLGDFNFDGYTDIGLQAQAPAYNLPYIYWFYDAESESFIYYGSFTCPLEPNAEARECVVNYRAGQTYYLDHYAVSEEHELVLYQRDITEYIDGKPVTHSEVIPGESTGSFENLFGLSGFYADEETIPHFITRTYYAQVTNGNAYPIAESFGFEIDDYVVDVDGDGVTELVCNCQYGGDGHESVYVFRRNGNIVERGYLDLEHKQLDMVMPAHWKSWGVNSSAERYIPEIGIFEVRYDTDHGTEVATTSHLEHFTFEEYARLPKDDAQLPTPITAENLFASMPSTFHFLSGAGGWQTELYWYGNGKFSGIFEDADAGEIYRCEFVGAVDAPQKIDDLVYSTHVKKLDYDKPGITTVENGVKITTSDPYGLDDADEIRIYLPGYPVKELPLEVTEWLRGGAEEFWDGKGPDTLPFFVLYNVRQQQAFFSADWSAFQGTDDPHLAKTVLTVVKEGTEFPLPAIRYMDLDYSLYVPQEGWQYQRALENDMLVKRWISEDNPDVSLTVRKLGYRDLADAQDWERTHCSKFSLVEDKQGGLFGEYNQNLLDIQFYQGQNTMYAVELRYPMYATEGYGAELQVIRDTFQLST